MDIDVKATNSFTTSDLIDRNSSLTTINVINNVNQWDSPETMAIAFAENKKAQMAARAMFELVHQFGDNLREGWKNVLDCLLHLLRSNLLPTQMIQMEDFVDPRGHISLKERFKRRRIVPKKEESGLFSWLGFTSSGTGDSDHNRRPTEEAKELCKIASNVVAECHPEQLVSDSRYLASSALTELINNIIHCSIALLPMPPAAQQAHVHPPQKHENRHHHETQGSQSQDDDSIVDLSAAAALLPVGEQEKQGVDQTLNAVVGTAESVISVGSKASTTESHPRVQEVHEQSPNFTKIKLSMDAEEALVFLLELMVNIVLENRDRLAQVWPLVRDHLHWLLTQFPQNQQLMERAIVASIRIANRNLFRLGQQQPPPTSPQPSQHAIVGGEKPTLGMMKSVVIVVEDDQQKPTDGFTSQTIQQRTNCCADEVLQFMGCQLLNLHPPELFLFSRQIAFGLHALLRVNAANVHSAEHWEMFFALLEAVGAAAYQEDDFDMIEQRLPHNATHLARKMHSKKSKHGRNPTVQSDPEEIAATPNQPTRLDDRGYCSDDPSNRLNENGCKETARKRPENPLLAAAMEHREQMRLLSKGDSGEWIHVVPTLAQQKTPAEIQQLQQIEEERGSNSAVNQMQTQPAIDEQQQPNQTASPPTSNVPESLIAKGIYVPVLPPAFPMPQQGQAVLDATTAQQSIPQMQQPIPQPPPPPHPRAGVFKRGTIVLAPNLSRHDPAAFLKVVEILTFLGRDAAHITPANFSQFTHCLRMMVEASMDGGKCAPVQLPTSTVTNHSHSAASKQFPVPHSTDKQKQTTENATVAAVEEAGVEKMSEQERIANMYMDASLQLLNICTQLHSRAANIYQDWSETNELKKGAPTHGTGCTELWTNYWRPLMQAMARMSCDCRRGIRAHALDTLGSAFRVPALGELMQSPDWEDCFAEVLFPLLSRLLTSSPPISPMDPIGMEEARIRAIQLTCKILLGHLTQISRLETFADLLRRLFDLMDQFLEGNACSDLLAEVMQESLKNCVLVCENFGVFQGALEGLQQEMHTRLEGLTKKHNGAGLKMSL